MSVDDFYDEPPVAVEPPRYDIEKVLALLRSAQPGPAPVAPRAGFLDRLGAGLSQIQAPGGGGHAGDVFGANLLAGAGRAFGGNRVAQRDAELKRQVDEYERNKAQTALETQAQIGGIGKDYEARGSAAKEAARAMALWRKEKREYEKGKADDLADKTKETQRQIEDKRDYGLKVRTEDRQAAKDRADAANAALPGGGKPPTVEAKRAAAFAERGRKAISNSDFINLENRIIAGGQSALMGLSAPRMLQNADQKNYRQSVETFALAFLRQESMASIRDEEFNQVFRTFFAQPGEDASTIEGKRRAREAALSGQEQMGETAGSVPRPPIPATWKKVQ